MSKYRFKNTDQMRDTVEPQGFDKLTVPRRKGSADAPLCRLGEKFRQALTRDKY
jgi:hypothetical protein